MGLRTLSVVLLVMTSILSITVPSMAQTSGSKQTGTTTTSTSAPTPAPPSPIHMKPELKDKFQAVFYKKIANQRTLDLLWDRFIQINPEAKKAQEDFTKSNLELENLVPELFKEQGVSIEAYKLDPEGTAEQPGPRFVPNPVPDSEPKQAAK